MRLIIIHRNPELLIALAQRLAETYRPCLVLLEPTDDEASAAQSGDPAATAACAEVRKGLEEVQ